jgi:hypothetical protein
MVPHRTVLNPHPFGMNPEASGRNGGLVRAAGAPVVGQHPERHEALQEDGYAHAREQQAEQPGQYLTDRRVHAAHERPEQQHAQQVERGTAT